MATKKISLILILLTSISATLSFNIVMMGAKRGGRGNLKRSLDDSSSSKTGNKSSVSTLNQGRGQEITGVSLPTEGNMKGWEFGKKQRLTCANVDGKFFVIQGECPRCGFDLFKGDIVTDEAFGDNPSDLPRIACPTCATTYGLRNGKYGPALKRTGFAGWVGNLAKTATINDATKDAKVFSLTFDEEEGTVFLKDM
mmetsp:Transcript_4083/g.5331  ORF Transcript_4083/g.5331 Transcript_4083/m.5331 type:complete len:197 (-) Transcript_4083:744-1334(-)